VLKRRAALLALFAATAGVAQAQRPILRVELASLSPDDPTNVTMAYGATAGIQVAARDAVIVRFLLQSGNRNSGADLGSRARHFYLLSLEHALGPERERLHQQYLVRVGVGLVERSPYQTAPAFSGGVGVRYGLARWLALVGAIEDVMAALPADSALGCYGTCMVVVGDKLQHNFNLAVAAEVRLR
jgi:hypothetical protein